MIETNEYGQHRHYPNGYWHREGIRHTAGTVIPTGHLPNSPYSGLFPIPAGKKILPTSIGEISISDENIRMCVVRVNCQRWQECPDDWLFGC